ncbi:hypothetical protein A3J15_01635 [Candidatus Roizmanbacteria bacterium RIFCSPLOWO2_02_FULL_38_10]|uniref:Probable DNA ligase n=1 Tax=Candidatus Roizmanbacteria bacterium RIFCSPLOWO2_02_FULL_38_10 TaxID=1802074 RepID=A0A1F7JLW3_9BACT|nr:MAG: hypothetical protein A3J15_01635 [Candidatus Roizmanbacteria bacterium RIFCSPLOWO2_02_FULL_38_10]
MTFKQLSVYFADIEATSSRLKITEILADLFRKISDSEIDKVLYLLQGRLTPLFVRLDFGLGEKMIIKALIEVLSIDAKVFVSHYKAVGDLGQTIEDLKKNIKQIPKKNISIIEVYDRLYKIAKSEGVGSQDQKITLLSNLIKDLDPSSARFVVRIPTNTLRLGFSDMTVLDAFSWMLAGDKSLRSKIEKAYHVRPDIGFIGRQIKKSGVAGLRLVEPKLFTPIIMMKAERLSSAKDILEKVPKAMIEPKYDGFRLQIHANKSDIKLYSRSLEDVSFMYPDVVEGVKKEIIAKEIIFEGEAIGYNPLINSFLPFQETVQRKRKYDIAEKAKEIPLKLFAFELLYADGINYLNIPFEKRRSILEKSIKLTGSKSTDTLLVSPKQTADSEKTINLSFEDAISKGLEGIMIKKIDGIYQPGARGWNWIKYKRSYASRIDDTIDCLVMGYDLGHGKRTDFGIGAFLVGILDEKKQQFMTVAKIGTGLTDEEWKTLKIAADKYKTDKQPNNYLVDKMMHVDVWISPKIVVEIKADELTRSPSHTAGRILKKSKSGSAYEVDVPGFALRFPRLARFRDDKRPEDVTTLKEIEKLFKLQKH